MQSIRWVNGRFVPASGRIAFVTFSNGRYLGLETKLQRSIQKWSPSADVYVFHDTAEIGAPPHSDVPYGFKIYCVEAVRKKGYNVIWWCDSVFRLTKTIDDLLPTLSARGVYLQEDGYGWKVGTWANDRALQYFGVTRDDVIDTPAVYACILGFDFRNPTAVEFMRRWKQAANNGIFAGQWKNTDKTESQDERCRGHRHDQTCAELIARTMGIPYSPCLVLEDGNKHFTSWDSPF